MDDDKSKRFLDGFAWHVGQPWHVDTEVHHFFIHRSHVCKKACHLVLLTENSEANAYGNAGDTRQG